MERLVKITKALADESRIRVLCALQDRELCVCQVIELLALAPSTISKHLSILRSARLIDSRKQGRWMYYRLAAPPGSDTVAQALAWVFRALAGSAQFLADKQHLARILEMDPEILCKQQSRAEACGAAATGTKTKKESAWRRQPNR
jgi:DNA-binding transcriptional ArsR family regulator